MWSSRVCPGVRGGESVGLTESGRAGLDDPGARCGALWQSAIGMAPFCRNLHFSSGALPHASRFRDVAPGP